VKTRTDTGSSKGEASMRQARNRDVMTSSRAGTVATSLAP
jgi:hypothetical protein